MRANTRYINSTRGALSGTFSFWFLFRGLSVHVRMFQDFSLAMLLPPLPPPPALTHTPSHLHRSELRFKVLCLILFPISTRPTSSRLQRLTVTLVFSASTRQTITSPSWATPTAPACPLAPPAPATAAATPSPSPTTWAPTSSLPTSASRVRVPPFSATYLSSSSFSPCFSCPFCPFDSDD